MEYISVLKTVTKDIEEHALELNEDKRVLTCAMIVVIGRWAHEEGWNEDDLVKTFISNLGVGQGKPTLGEPS